MQFAELEIADEREWDVLKALLDEQRCPISAKPSEFPHRAMYKVSDPPMWVGYWQRYESQIRDRRTIPLGSSREHEAIVQLLRENEIPQWHMVLTWGPSLTCKVSVTHEVAQLIERNQARIDKSAAESVAASRRKDEEATERREREDREARERRADDARWRKEQLEREDERMRDNLSKGILPL